MDQHGYPANILQDIFNRLQQGICHNHVNALQPIHSMNASYDSFQLASRFNHLLTMIQKKYQAAAALQALRYATTTKENYVEQFTRRVVDYFGNEAYRRVISSIGNSTIIKKCEDQIIRLKESLPKQMCLQTKIYLLVQKMNRFDQLISACSSDQTLDKLEGAEYSAYYYYLEHKDMQNNQNIFPYLSKLEKIESLKIFVDQVSEKWSAFQKLGIKFKASDKQVSDRFNELAIFIEENQANFQKQIAMLVFFIGQCVKHLELKQNTDLSCDYLENLKLKEKCKHLVKAIQDANRSQSNKKQGSYQKIQPIMKIGWAGHNSQTVNYLNYHAAANFIREIAKICIDTKLFSAEDSSDYYLKKWDIFSTIVLKKFTQILSIQRQNQAYRQFVKEIEEEVQIKQIEQIVEVQRDESPEKIARQLFQLKNTLRSRISVRDCYQLKKRNSEEQTPKQQIENDNRSHLAFRAQIFTGSVSQIFNKDLTCQKQQQIQESFESKLNQEHQITISRLRNEFQEKQSLFNIQLTEKNQQIIQIRTSQEKLKQIYELQKQELQSIQGQLLKLKDQIQDVTHQNEQLVLKLIRQTSEKAVNTELEKQIDQQPLSNKDDNYLMAQQPQIKIFTADYEDNRLFPSGSAFNSSHQFVSQLLGEVRRTKERSPLKINMIFSTTLNSNPETKPISNKPNILLVIRTDSDAIIGGFTEYPFYDANTTQRFKQNEKRSFLFSQVADRFVSLPLQRKDEEPNLLVHDMLKLGKSEIRVNMNKSYNGKVTFKLGEAGSLYSSGQSFNYEEFVGFKSKEANIRVLEIFQFVYENENISAFDSRSQKKQRKGSEEIQSLSRIKSTNERPSRQGEEKMYPPKPQAQGGQSQKAKSIQKVVADPRAAKYEAELKKLRQQKREIQQKIEVVTIQREEALQQKLAIQSQLEEQVHKLQCEVYTLKKNNESNAAKLQKQLSEKARKKIKIQQVKEQQEQERAKLNQEIAFLKSELEATKQKYEAARDKILGRSILEMSMIKKETEQKVPSEEDLNESNFTILNQEEKEDVEKIKEELRKQFEKEIKRVNLECEQAKSEKQFANTELQLKLKLIQELEAKIAQLEKDGSELNARIAQITELERQACMLRKAKTDYETALSETIRGPASLKLEADSLAQEYVHYSRTLLAADIFDRNEEDKVCLLSHISRYARKRVVKTTLLYKFDPRNNTNVHHYVDNKRGLLCVVKTANAIIAGFYPGTLVERGILNEGGLLVSVTNNLSFPLLEQNQRPESNRITFRGMTYDTFYVIFGNAEMRIRTGEKRVFSNFGISSSYYNNGGKRVNSFLNEGDQREVDFEFSEYYQVFFDEENLYRPEERTPRFERKTP